MEGSMSENEKKAGVDIHRRSFLKGIAVTGAMSAMAAVHPASGAQPPGENKSGVKSWRDRPDPINESLISDGGIYDVVVVGGGNAGLICACAASMKGASVAVIENQTEKTYVPGSGKEVGHVNSQYAMSQGAPRINEDEFLREWARRMVIRHNPKRASYFVKNSGKILDRVISLVDKEWMADNCHVMSCPPKPAVLLEVSGWRFFYGTAIFLGKKQNAGREMWPVLLKMHKEKAEAGGAKWFFEHHAEVCDLDGSGAVTGVVAKRADGKYIRFKARKGVALCAGDFSANREMVIDILDDLRHQAEAQGDMNLVQTSRGMGLTRDGSGIKLGIWAGGHIEIGPRSTMGSGDPGTGAWYLQLDENGERFCDEAAGTTLSRSKDSFTVTLMDSNWKQVIEMMPPRHMAPDTADSGGTLGGRLSYFDNVKPGPISKSQQGGMPGGGPNGLPGVSGTPCCGNTVEELLDYLGCYKGDAREKALAGIKRYNEMCKKGVDEDFGKDPRIMKVTGLKDPPFYGVLSNYSGPGMFGGISPGMCATTGLDTDADGCVLDSNFKPIKGLYAAGNNAGGRFITVYQSPLAGISIGMAMTEGYMLGERLAGL
jgi:fumarate reductase flavoprotein subunit